MPPRDYRCLLSGLSLLDADVAVVLLEASAHGFEPMALPIWGSYRGAGLVEEIDEGPNASLVLQTLCAAESRKDLVVDWSRMGLTPFDWHDMSSFLSLVAFAQIHCSGAVSFAGKAVEFSLIEANVAATLMEREVPRLDRVRLEDLPTEIFAAGSAGRTLYEHLTNLPLRLRCKFGVSLAGLAALKDFVAADGPSWRSPGVGIALLESRPEAWLADALLRFGGQEDLVQALSDYNQADTDALVS